MTRALTLTAAEWEVLQRDGTAWIAWDAINDPCDHIRYACRSPVPSLPRPSVGSWQP